MLLNRCRGIVVRDVAARLFVAYPTALELSQAEPAALVELLKPLGFQNRRAKTLLAFSEAFAKREWKDASELPGIGEYARDCWRIFFLEDLGDTPPKDHALVDYWKLAKEGLWPERGWLPDADVIERRRRVEDFLDQRRLRKLSNPLRKAKKEEAKP